MLDFRNAYYDHIGENGIRMPIVSRTVIAPPNAAPRTFYRIAHHLGEFTYDPTKIFKVPEPYTFHPILEAPGGPTEFFAREWRDMTGNGYRQLFPVADHPSWGTRIAIVPEANATELTTVEAVKQARANGAFIVVRAAFTRNDHAVVIDAPTAAVLTDDDPPNWQVQAKVAYPNLSSIPDDLMEHFELSFMAVNSAAQDRVEFLPKAVMTIGGYEQVVHYIDAPRVETCTTSLWAL